MYFNYPGCLQVARPPISTKVQPRKVDVAFIYADPLVNLKEDEKDPGKELEYMREYEMIVEQIKGNRLDIKALKVAGNFETIKDVFKHRPTIIHISCHGEDKEDTFKLGVE